MLVLNTDEGAAAVDLDAVRADLEQVVRESDAAIASLAAEEADESSELGAPEQHPSDAANEQSESDREDALVEAAEERRAEALAALARLDSGAYGVCIDCGEKIAEARLEFRPEAARCLTCQQKHEAAEA